MLIGIGEFGLAGVSVILSLFILFAMDYLQFRIDYYFQHRDYRLLLHDNTDTAAICSHITSLGLTYNNLKILRDDIKITMEMEIRGRRDRLEQFNSWLLLQPGIGSFEW